MRSKKYLHYLLVVLIISGCGEIVHYVDTNPTLSPDKGYVYGLFSVEEENSINIGLVLENTETKKEYTIKFIGARSIYAIAITPGTYKITKIVFSKQFGMREGEQDITKLKKISKEFTVKKGNAYYIGDFYSDTHNFNIGAGTTLYWRVKDIRYNFEDTTKKFIQQNPRFEKVNTIPAFDFAQE